MKPLYTLTTAALVLGTVLSSAAFAGNSVWVDQQGDRSAIWLDQRGGGDTSIRSYGDDQWLDIDFLGTGDFDVLALGDGVDGAVIGRGSDGASVTFGMCPPGMHSATVVQGPHSYGLTVAPCVWSH